MVVDRAINRSLVAFGQYYQTWAWMCGDLAEARNIA